MSPRVVLQSSWPHRKIGSFFFFFNNLVFSKPFRFFLIYFLVIHLFIYLFIFGCVGASFLCEGFL